jgi:predicted amidohydrolase YtcJ
MTPREGRDDVLIRNARVYTVDAERPWVEAVAVRDGRIAAVGDDAEAVSAAPRRAQEIDAAGRLVLPGFVDAHNHVRLGSDADAVQLGEATTLEEVRARIDAHAAERPDDAWIVAEEWSYSALPEPRRPRADDLEGVAPGRAVMVLSYDVHNAWLNREAMARFGIGAGTSSVPFGRVELDERGEPTGFVTDFAVMGLSRAGNAALAAQVPNFGPASAYRRLVHSLDLATECGITTIVEPQNSVDDLPLFARAREDGALRSRLIAALFHPEGTTADELDEFDEARRAFDDDRLRVGPVKLYIDDVIEARTAGLLQPYADDPGNRGGTFYEPGAFAAVIVELERRGFQTFTHATGDRGIRTALDAVAYARGVHGPRDARHQLVHVELVHPDDIGRFAELGVVACMQPRHAAPDIVDVWREAVGDDRPSLPFPWRSLAERGAVLAFSSDWNVAQMEPIVGIYSALTRADLHGEGGWSTDQTVDLETAIRGYTTGSAFANFVEHDRGSITRGKAADLVVLSDDLFRLEPAEILDASVDLTIVDGEVVHEAR